MNVFEQKIFAELAAQRQALHKQFPERPEEFSDDDLRSFAQERYEREGARLGWTRRVEQEAAFEAAYPEGFDRANEEIEALKRYGLYCGVCGHGNGCEHGVPPSAY